MFLWPRFLQIIKQKTSDVWEVNETVNSSRKNTFLVVFSTDSFYYLHWSKEQGSSTLACDVFQKINVPFRRVRTSKCHFLDLVRHNSLAVFKHLLCEAVPCKFRLSSTLTVEHKWVERKCLPAVFVFCLRPKLIGTKVSHYWQKL